MSGMGEFWQSVDERSKKNNQEPVLLGQVTSIEPLKIMFQGIEIGKEYGDTIYINSMMSDSIKTFNKADKLFGYSNTMIYPEGQSGTEANHRAIIDEITAWINTIQNLYILKINDTVAVQGLGNNTYIVLSKVQEV